MKYKVPPFVSLDLSVVMLLHINELVSKLRKLLLFIPKELEEKVIDSVGSPV